MPRLVVETALPHGNEFPAKIMSLGSPKQTGSPNKRVSMPDMGTRAETMSLKSPAGRRPMLLHDRALGSPEGPAARLMSPGGLDRSITTYLGKESPMVHRRSRLRLARLRESLQQSRDSAQFLPSATNVVEIIEQARQDTHSSEVTRSLLQSAAELSELIVGFTDLWLADAGLASSVWDLARSLDASALKLAAESADARWSDVAQRVEGSLKARLEAFCSARLCDIERHLSQRDFESLFEVCKQLIVWWPCAQHWRGPSSVAGVLTSAQQGAVSEFMRSTRCGDQNMVRQIRRFAQRMDELRQQSGCLLPPAVGGRVSDGSLTGALVIGETLLSGQATANIDCHLEMLSTEVEGLVSSAAGHESLRWRQAALLITLETLACVWPCSEASRELQACADRLMFICDGIESWAESEVPFISSLMQLEAFLEFAERYDRVWSMGSDTATPARQKARWPPVCSPQWIESVALRGTLRARVARIAAVHHIEAVEAELRSMHGLDPTRLLDGLHAAAVALSEPLFNEQCKPGEDVPSSENRGFDGAPELNIRLEEACRATEECIFRTFGVLPLALPAEEARKRLSHYVTLLDFMRTNGTGITLAPARCLDLMDSHGDGAWYSVEPEGVYWPDVEKLRI